ncbi:bestrophin-like domain [Streptomyces sp. NPDC002853]
MPEWLVYTLASILVCVLVITATLMRHRRVDADEDTSQTPDVLEYMVMMVGVVYAIVLGLAIAGVWEARGAAEDTVQREAQALYEVDQRLDVYPAAFRSQIKDHINAYAHHAVTTEWPALKNDTPLDTTGADLLARIRHDIAHHTPANELQAQAYQPLLDQVAAADDARHQRLDNAGTTLPGALWFGLIAGAVITLALLYTLQIRRSARELILATTFSALIVFLLFLVWSFDAPLGHTGTDTAQPLTDLITTT